jgi:hypothetical protein
LDPSFTNLNLSFQGIDIDAEGSEDSYSIGDVSEGLAEVKTESLLNKIGSIGLSG